MSKELEGNARTRPELLRVVLDPCVQCCPFEASEQKMGQIIKIVLKEIELSYCHHSICLKNEQLKSNNVKIGWKMTELAHFMSIGPKLAILSPKNHKNGHISKDHFAEVSFTKKPTPPTFFNKFA